MSTQHYYVTEQFIRALGRPVTTEVTTEVRLVQVLVGERTRQELQEILDLKNDEHFRRAYMLPALEAGLIEMTIPEKPTSRLQKYRLTEKGRAWAVMAGRKGAS